jgi:hypothetical protein
MSTYVRTTDRPYYYWTEGEQAFMREWYGIIKPSLLAECVHHTQRACEAEAGRLGLRAPRQRMKFYQFYEGKV